MSQYEKGVIKSKSKVASINGSMLASLIYLVTICWVVPIFPIVIIWFFDLNFLGLLFLWVDGLPFLCLAWQLLLLRSRRHFK